MSEPEKPKPKGSRKDPANWKVPESVNNPEGRSSAPVYKTGGGKPAFGMSRRSKIVTAGVITTLVGGGLYGLNAVTNNNNKSQNANDKRCVDANNVVVDDSQCSNGGGGHYYYGGFGGFYPGAIVSGGSNTAPTKNSTVRGGIGSGSDTSKATSGSAGS